MIETTYTDPAQNGRVGVIGPHGVLFRGGAEGLIRRKLVEENLLDAVIGLPPNLFFGAGIPAVILIFKRNRPDDRVLFVDASGEFEGSLHRTACGRRTLSEIQRPTEQRQDAGQVRLPGDVRGNRENDFNLNIPRYVDTFEPKRI